MGPEIEPLIDIALLRDALPRLTSDAVKLGVWLASVNAPERADAAWAKEIGPLIGLPEKIVLRTVKELSDEGLVTLARRVELSKASDGCHRVARQRGRRNAERPQDADGGANEDSPPWERKGDEPRSGEVKGVAGDAEVERGARGLNGELRPESSLLLDGKPVSPHTYVVAKLHSMWRDCYANGDPDVNPSWGPRQGKVVKTLLGFHSAEEIVRRATIMFYEKRRWPEGPYDVFVLSTHFDKFAVAKAPGGMVGDSRRTGPAYYGEVTRDD